MTRELVPAPSEPTIRDRFDAVRSLNARVGRAFGEEFHEMGVDQLPGIRQSLCVGNAAVAITTAAHDDLKSKSRKEGLTAIGNGIGIAAVEAVGFTRIPTAAALSLPLAFCESKGIPVMAAAPMAAAANGGWNFIVATTLNGGVNHLPKTCETIKERVDHTDKLSHVVSGLEPKPEGEKHGFPLRLSRGASTYSMGVLTYILSAASQNQSREERWGLCKNIGKDAAIFLGSVATLLTTTATVADLSVEGDSKFADGLIAGGANTELMTKVAWGYVGLNLVAQLGPKAAKRIAQRIKKKIALQRTELEPSYD